MVRPATKQVMIDPTRKKRGEQGTTNLGESELPNCLFATLQPPVQMEEDDIAQLRPMGEGPGPRTPISAKPGAGRVLQIVGSAPWRARGNESSLCDQRKQKKARSHSLVWRAVGPQRDVVDSVLLCFFSVKKELAGEQVFHVS